MPNNERRSQCYTPRRLRRCLAITAVVICVLAATAFTNAADALRGSFPDSRALAATPSAALSASAYDGAPVVSVATVEELYAAVNNPANAGAAVALAPGTYTLTANAPGGAARPNGGRLELQPDMSLYGVAGDRAAVRIDTSALPSSSLTASPVGRTGSIRLGRGSNAVEWLTIVGNPAAASGIETDLAGTAPTRIRIAHVVSGGSSRGVDIRNVGAPNAGRRIDAEVLDSDLSAGAAATGVTEAIRIANFNGANGGQIYVTMSGNRGHDSLAGCIMANNRTNSGVIAVSSYGDRFEHNSAGCIITGSAALTGGGGSNSVTFEAHGSEFVNNDKPLPPPSPNVPSDAGGIYALGADISGANVASNNTVTIRLWGGKVSGNQNTDFAAFGARSNASNPGTNNRVTIELRDLTERIYVAATDSVPAEPAGTNKVIVPPYVKAKDATLPADDACAAAVSPAAVDEGSYDPTGGSLTLALDPAGPFGLGAHAVSLTAANSRGVSNSAAASVTVVDQTPPTISAPPAVTVFTGAGAASCGAFVSDEALGEAQANDNCSFAISRGVPEGNFFPTGTTEITYTATDASGNSASAKQTVTVVDDTPPVITGAAVDQPTLGPPNHRMVDVAVAYAASDNCGAASTSLGVASNEPANGIGDGDTAPDWEVLDAHHVRLRAERAAQGRGRTYTITITATDGNGNTSSQAVAVRVPHN